MAPLLDLFGRLDAKTLLETERGRVLAKVISERVSVKRRAGSERGSVSDLCYPALYQIDSAG